MKVRALGQYGILRDYEPYDLPLNAWSAGNNVAFAEGKVKRAPGIRSIDDPTPTDPSFLMSVTQPDGAAFLVYPDNDGSLYKWIGGTETDVTPAGFVSGASTEPFTGCVLSGVAYINRSTDVPYGYRSTDSDFVVIPAWDVNHKAKVIRKYKDFLIALNVTKSGVEYPRLFKTSHLALNNAFPDSFDHTNLTKLTYETEVTQINGPIIDGMELRQSFVVYGNTQCAMVNFTGGSTIYDIKPLFQDGGAGVINANCVVEVNGQHYVFGSNDIYTHDGVQKKSIVAGRNQRYIFDNIDKSKAHRCFVFHNTRTHTVHFCYVSVDEDAAFPGTTGCNRSAVYAYLEDTWSFSDLPSVNGVAEVNVAQVLTWATVTGSYSDAGSTYALIDATKLDATVMVCQQETALGLTTSKIAAFDGLDKDSLIPYGIYTAANPEAYIERTGLDLEELGDGDLAAYKLINRLLPQAKVFRDDVSVTFKTGSQMFPDGPLTWSADKNFTSRSQYKVDVRKGGRYLAIHARMPTANDFEWSGYDADAGSLSRR